MALNIQKLETAHAGKGKKLWTYDPTADILATVEGAGYFNDASDHFSVGDMVHILGIPYVVTIIAAGVVTIAQSGVKVVITLAESGTTDGIDITMTVKDVLGNTIAAAHALDVWISEASTGIGITGESYSGDVTVVTGAEMVEHVSKKVFQVVTAVTGILGMLAVDSSNETDQYFCAAIPGTGRIAVSAASGTTWEGV